MLDGARTRGIYVEFYDPDGTRYGLPTYPYHWAPRHLVTVRQLRARGLRPGGQQPAAQILWRKGRRVAYLYRIDLALPKRQATPAQLDRDRRRAARPPHLPRLRPGKALLHPALTRRMQRLRGPVTTMTTATPNPDPTVKQVLDTANGAGGSSRTTTTPPSSAASSAPTAAASRPATSTPSPTWPRLADDLDHAIRDAITGLRGHGYSWADIGTRLGITRQAAQQRWGGDAP